MKDTKMDIRTGLRAGLYWLEGQIGKPGGKWKSFSGWYSGAQPVWYNTPAGGTTAPKVNRREIPPA